MTTSYYDHKKATFFVVLLIGLFALSWAREPLAENYWSRNDPNSPNRIDHSLWNQLLGAMLVPYEDVKDQVSSSKWDCRTTDSRIPKCDIGVGSTNNLKGVNLVTYKYFKPEFVYFIRSYLDSMSDVPILSYRKDEQLAYWLNVHNALVVLKIYEEYPVESVADLRDTPRIKPKKPIVWVKNAITIEGRSLSIRDIEQDIIFKNWKNPNVIYGLFDGSVSSPTLRKSAYLGSQVHAQLAANAENFVNSPRVLRFRSEVAKVSSAYGWAHALFDEPEEILVHIADLRPSLANRMRAVRRVRETFYDYDLAAFEPKSDLQDRMALDRIVDFNGGSVGGGVFGGGGGN